jgi:hypothetical protein
MIFGPPWPNWYGRRTQVPAREGRTVAELLDDSDGLARVALLDISADQALGMVRGWPPADAIRSRTVGRRSG